MTRPVETVGTATFGKCPVVSNQMAPCWGDLRAYEHQPEHRTAHVTVQCVVCGGLLVAAKSEAFDRPVSRVFGEDA